MLGTDVRGAIERRSYITNVNIFPFRECCCGETFILIGIFPYHICLTLMFSLFSFQFNSHKIIEICITIFHGTFSLFLMASKE